MKKILILFCSAILLISQSCSGGKEKTCIVADSKQKLKDWKIESSTMVKEDGSVVSGNSYNDEKWTNAVVPTTVLRALVKAGIYPDPHFDLNDLRIPDASDDLNKRLNLGQYSHLKDHPNAFKDPYWFRTTFKISPENKGKKIWLNFDGINYRADLWINGKQIANSGEMAGMFQRFRFDITKYANTEGDNVLAVLIHQVDHVGTPNPGYLFEPFGQFKGQGEDIFKDVTLKFSAGWDCAPVVRDRNMGIYQDVYLTYTGDVKIVDPYIVTDLPLPDTTLANITVSTDLENSGASNRTCVLKGSIDLITDVDFLTYKKHMPGSLNTITFEKKVEVPAGETVNVTFTPKDFKQLSVKNPFLWWPNGYGKQYLHNLKLAVETNGSVSDVKNTTFGIRTITSTIKEIDGEYGRVFWVNGQRIFVRGGWIQPDMMLDMNEKRMYDEGRLMAEANVNMIGCEDMPSPPDMVMDVYDKYGLLMWEDFYQCWTAYPGLPSFANPLDTKLSLKNSYDIVKRYRNHPSLSIYAMANESLVREEIYVPLREYIRKNDPTRPFVATSSYGWDVDKLTPYMKPDLPTGTTDEGTPDYTWYPHHYYYDKVLEVKQQMFRNELGVPAVSTLSSMKKYIFDLGQGKKNAIYPLDKKWAYHDAWDGDGYAFKAYDEAIRREFGQPVSAEEYIRNAQYVNAGSYRAMYEAANHRMWNITTGVMIWKLNATWPQVLWQIYDWFLNPNAGYFYAKKAMEPLHIQLNENNFTVSVINRNHVSHEGLTASVKVIDIDSNIKWSKDEKLSIDQDCYKELLQIPHIDGLTPVYFVKLELKDEKGNVLSDNFYWFSSTGKDDLSQLAKLNKPGLDIKKDVTYQDDQVIIKVTVSNPSGKLAFFNRMMVIKGEGGDEVLPTFWSDNYFSLLPGETKSVIAKFAKQDLDGKEPVVVLDKDI
jgi:beta-galactosidase/beta-glucuronidase